MNQNRIKDVDLIMHGLPDKFVRNMNHHLLFKEIRKWTLKVSLGYERFPLLLDKVNANLETKYLRGYLF